MIFAGGKLLRDSDLNPVLGYLEEEIIQTLSGPPLAAETVLDIFRSRDLVSHAKEMGRYLWDKLEEIKDKYAVVTGHRGIGLMQGLEFSVPVGPVVTDALLNQKLVLISAGTDIIRFVPPLVIGRENVDEMAKRLEAAIEATVCR